VASTIIAHAEKTYGILGSSFTLILEFDQAAYKSLDQTNNMIIKCLDVSPPP